MVIYIFLMYLNILNDIKECDMKLTYEHIFEIERQINDVEMSLEITDVEKYDKAYINIKAIPDERTVPGFKAILICFIISLN